MGMTGGATPDLFVTDNVRSLYFHRYECTLVILPVDKLGLRVVSLIKCLPASCCAQTQAVYLDLQMYLQQVD